MLRAGAEPDPSWGEIRHATARELMEHAEETRPSDAQMRVLGTADADVAELEAALRDCPAAELRAATLPPSAARPSTWRRRAARWRWCRRADAGCERTRALRTARPRPLGGGSSRAAVVRALLRLGVADDADVDVGSTVRGDNSGQTAAHWAAGRATTTRSARLDADPHALLVRDERQLDVAAVAARDGHGATAWDSTPWVGSASCACA